MSTKITDKMDKHGNGRPNADLLMSSAQCWRLNEIGCLQIRQEPGLPISRDTAKALLAELARAGVWEPRPRAGKS